MIKITETGKCKNCKYEGPSKEGSFNLCPVCLFNSMIIQDSEPEEIPHRGDFHSEVRGDGSVGIKGNLQVSDKQSAIMLITGMMETFDITTEELEY